MNPDQARIRKLEERNEDLQQALTEARDELGWCIAFADPYNPESVKVVQDHLRKADDLLKPFDLREDDDD